MKGAIDLALLLMMPRHGASVPATTTSVFLYEAVAKLLSAYPARKLSAAPDDNLGCTPRSWWAIMLVNSPRKFAQLEASCPILEKHQRRLEARSVRAAQAGRGRHLGGGMRPASAR